MMRSDVVEVLFLRDGRALKQHFDPNSQISMITSTTGNPATAFFLFRFLVELKAGRELDIARVSRTCCCLDTCAWSVLGSLSHEGWVGGWVCLAPRGSEAASEEPAPGHHGFQKSSHLCLLRRIPKLARANDTTVWNQLHPQWVRQD